MRVLIALAFCFMLSGNVPTEHQKLSRCLDVKPLCWPGEKAVCICAGWEFDSCNWVCVQE